MMKNENLEMNELELTTAEQNEMNGLIYKNSEGKYRRKVEYPEFISHPPKTREEKIEFYNLLNANSEDESDNVVPLRNMVGKEIIVKQYIAKRYTSVDEDTGEVTNGILTYFKDDDMYYATSSKTVANSIGRMFEAFGYPNDSAYIPIKVKVTGKRAKQGVQIDVVLLP